MRSMDKATLSLSELFSHKSDSWLKYGGKVSHTEEAGTEYFDLWYEGNIVCMDGEPCALLGKYIEPDGSRYFLLEGPEGHAFKLSEEEYNIAAFGVAAEQAKKYVYDIYVPVVGRLEAHVESDIPLTKEEAMNKAFEEADLGEVRDADIGDYDLDTLYAEGEFV